ncbi:ankyrin repeat protein [Diaporthe eres]|nr:ankyrin repeat protein [Diaporthe eres]
MEDHKPQEHKQVDSDSIHEDDQVASHKDRHPLHSATSAQQVDSTESPGTPNGADERGSKPDTTRPADHTLMLSRSTDAKVSGTAYDEAWSRLSEDERANLSNETSIKTLFEELDETDQQHQSASWLKRGKMAAGLQYVSNICNYINLVASWIPLPELGAVLGLFKGVIAIVVGICGAYDGLTGHIREFLNHIPVIERCNTVLWSNSASSEIHKVSQLAFDPAATFTRLELMINEILVACYSTLLAFYRIITNFNGHADRLSNMMEAETLVTVKKILDQQTEDFVNDNLYKQHHIGNHNVDEGDISDEACCWIISEDSFEDWAYGPHGVLTMYGVVGCGKTVMAAFVTKYLREEARAPVLAYHCTQQEDDEIRYILCSLTYQLLQAKSELKEKFKDWSENRQATTLDKPSNKPAVLAEFLCSSLQDSKEQVFIVLDGLDECDEDDRSDVLALFRNLISNGALVKVFVSSRQRDDILQTLTSSETTEDEPATEPVRQIPLFHIDMNPTEERDHILAKHLGDKPLRQIKDSKVRERAIEQLAKRAGGSAIWLQMAMASLAGAKNESRIVKCLEFLETDPKLVEMYEQLFRDAESATCNDREILERALETLAVARRPMTIDELARAAHLDDDESAESLVLLNEAAEGIDFLSLIRPFVATLESPVDGKGLAVRLVHQSLLELLLTARPSEWDEMAASNEQKRVTDKEKEKRKRKLNEQLMGRCVKYLLLGDLEDTPSDGDADRVPHTAADDEEPWDGFGFDEMFAEPVAQMRTQTRAQISHLHFYEYAASHWVSHFAACESDVADDLRERALTLLDVTCSGCSDWVSFVRTESEAEGELFPISSEPATLAAHFGLEETLAGILAGPGAVSQQAKDEALFWASRGGRERIVRLLLENDADANQHHLADHHTALIAAAHRGHLGCVQALLADPRTDVNAQGSRDRTALMLGASSGHEKICAALVQHEDCRPDGTDWKRMTALFYAVGVENVPIIKALTGLPDVNVNHQDIAGRTALCRSAETGTIASLKQLVNTEGVDVNLPDNEGRSPLMWAAFRRNAVSVDALLQHAEIDKAAFQPKDRKNAIHFACEGGAHEALLCLLKHDCPGIDDPDVDGWTPLMWSVQNGPGCASTLLATGRVEVDRRDDDGKTALSLAVQWGHSVEVIRVLLHYGADPETTDNNGLTPLNVAMQRGLPVDFRMADELSSWINKKRSEHDPVVEDT